MRVGQPARLQRRLRLIDIGAFDEGFVMRLLPNAVVEGEDLDVAHLVLLEARASWCLLRVGRADEGDRLRKTERRVGTGGAKHEITT